MPNLSVESNGAIVLPDGLRKRYGFHQDTPVRVIETRNGVLLIPLTDAPASPELARELSDWQSLAASSWEMFDDSRGN